MDQCQEGTAAGTVLVIREVDPVAVRRELGWRGCAQPDGQQAEVPLGHARLQRIPLAA